MPTDVETTLSLFKALSDASRLRLLGLLATSEHSVDELAAMLDLRSPTVSHHLTRLREIGLVSLRVDGNVHLYQLDKQALATLSRDVLSPERVASFADTLEVEAWKKKVLRDFFDGQRLKEIPSSRKKRAVVLEHLADDFHVGHKYREREVNDVLLRRHEDPATLRRELVGAGLLQRERSVYWRPAQQ